MSLEPHARLSGRVVILYGALRSGTTMLRLMLDAHPAITCPGEADFLVDHLTQGLDGTWALDTEKLKLGRIYRASGLKLNETLDAEAAVLDLIGQMAGRDGATLVIVLHRNLERALQLLPGCPVLHLLRDPRDVARSAIGMGWAGNTYFGASHWIRTEQDWDATAPRRTPGQVTTVTYEDLVRAPEAELTRICTALSLPYAEAMLSYDHNSTYERPDPGLIEQWRRKQTPREIARTESRLRPMMLARGYVPATAAPVRVTVLERRWLWLDNKARVWAGKIRKHGLVDPLVATIARRIGAEKLRSAAQLRMNATAARHLK